MTQASKFNKDMSPVFAIIVSEVGAIKVNYPNDDRQAQQNIQQYVEWEVFRLKKDMRLPIVISLIDEGILDSNIDLDDMSLINLSSNLSGQLAGYHAMAILKKKGPAHMANLVDDGLPDAKMRSVIDMFIKLFERTELDLLPPQARVYAKRSAVSQDFNL